MPSQKVSNNVSEIKTSGIGPGDRLQAARIEAGLSIEDVANRMHLSVSILESLEENNFDDITAPIFVKGYLRAYARIVSLSEDEMIQQYIDFYSGEDPPINSTSNTSPEISADDARVKWTTYIVIIVLCGLLAAWWWNKNQNLSDLVSLDVDPANAVSEESVDTVVEAPLESVVEEPIDTVAEMSVNDSSEPEITSTNEDIVETITTTVPVEELQEADENSLAEPEIAATVEPVAVVEPEPVDEPELPSISEEVVETNTVSEPEVTDSGSDSPAETIGQTAATGDDRLELTINADTWADIKDANGNRLAYDLLRANNRLILTGQAPFSLFFGNGHGVELTFNDEEIDLSDRIRSDNTARLKIGNN